ncbi:CPBP family intramembrane metalloprotease [Muricauda sp. JGD-17]|uniref:CPBP family intramembrane metalloprotease n=1 Tax=Flagellimonas ochracea TaxID=2696472 RepID=A0A964TEU5_9FLAO|nr:CPBP family intramembrane glutamic endopeptidase [Allomuricauda ochracea]NAY92191.1 CPBP family intramembrane metalloprotease [Allomuricauda ochracea]
MKKLIIPVWAKAIFFGFIILELGTKLWSLIAIANFSTSPKIPWSFPLMAVVLVLLWNYLDGNWMPRSTQGIRHLWMRANSLKIKHRKWGWISAVLLGCTIFCFAVLGMRIVDVPSGQIVQIEHISKYPPWTIISLITMTSVTAGVIEEISFRGYMQKPMELKYGPKIAITVVALFFTILHLPNATITPGLIPIFFLGSIGWGVLAYLTNSIIPGVVVHGAVDIIGYFSIWKNLELVKALSTKSVLKTGMDAPFLILLLITLMFTLLTVFGFKKLDRLNRKII